jgi:TP901 family phage tail tape measure protein
MSSKTTSWILELVDKITPPLRRVQEEADNTAESAERIKKRLDEAKEAGERFNQLAVEFGAKAFLFNQAADGIAKFNSYFKDAIAPGAGLETQMAKLSTISGKTGDDLKSLEKQAKDLGAEFGVGASAMADSFMDAIGSLGDSFGESEEALAAMGRNIGTLSKLMDGDAKGAANALSTAMLQYGVDLNNPIEAAKEATRMMNVMQAAANVGGSEVVDTAEALRQSGLLAKQSGLSFEELNASLEGLAKGKIMGGEAGTAMRNILLSMSTLANSPKQVIEGLKAYGVNVDLVADPTVKFTDRLRELQKIQNDPGLMESVFMKANIAAGQTMLNNIDTIDEWTVAVTGTNAAVEGAAVIMDTYEEKMARTNARIDNFKASMFDIISPIAPFISLTGDAVNGVADLSVAVWGLSILFKKDLYMGIWTGIKTIALFAKSSVMAAITSGGAFTTLSGVVSVACKVIGVAIMNIPIIGWIAAIIAALIALGVYFYNTSATFRGFLWGIWEAIKTVFTGIGKFIKEVLEGVWHLIKGVFNPANWFDDNYKFSDGLDRITNAATSYGESISKAFQAGKAAGITDFEEEKKSRENGGSDAVDIAPAPFVGAKSVTGNTPPVKPVKPVATDKNSKKTTSGISGVGSGGGKSVTMNVTLNINNNGIKNPDEFTEQVVRKINDKLNDALAQTS